MPSRNKTKAQLETENRILRRGHSATGFVSVINNFIKFGALVLIVRYIYLSIGALAGKETFANILIGFFANLTVSQTLAYIFGAGGVLYASGERVLRKRTVRRLQGRIIELEAAKDPHRSSSNLTPLGETHPRDRT